MQQLVFVYAYQFGYPMAWPGIELALSYYF